MGTTCIGGRLRRFVLLVVLALVGAFAFAGLANAAGPTALVNGDTSYGAEASYATSQGLHGDDRQ